MKVSKRACLVALCVTGGRAWADPSGPCPKCVALSAPLCSPAPIDRQAYASALRVELSAEGFEVRGTSAPSEGFVLSIEPVSCGAGATLVEIAVTNVRSGVRLVRKISLSDLDPEIRSRTAALASAELVGRAATVEGAPTAARGIAPPSNSTPSSEPSALAPVANPAPDDATRAPAKGGPSPPPDKSIQRQASFSPTPILRPPLLAFIGGSVDYRRYFAPETSLVGGRIASAWRSPWNPIELRGDLFFATASRDVALGTVVTRLASGVAGVEWTLGGDRLRFDAGPAVELGYVWTDGQASGSAKANQGGHFAMALLVEAGARVQFAPGLLGIAEVGCGAELAGIRAFAENEIAGGVSGIFVLARAGLAYAP